MCAIFLTKKNFIDDIKYDLSALEVYLKFFTD